jgi:hypothetical protein
LASIQCPYGGTCYEWCSQSQAWEAKSLSPEQFDPERRQTGDSVDAGPWDIDFLFVQQAEER